MTALLELDDVEVRYGSALALQHVDLVVEQAGLVGIVGPNGAGKTTLLRTISGSIRPTAGRIRWRGEDVKRATPHAMVRRGVAHVPEGRRLIAELDVVENLRVGAIAAGRPARSGIDEVVALFPALERLLERRAGGLSGGEQQMVAIGRGLMAKPELLLVDELSLGLAPKITVELLVALVSLAERGDLAIVLVDQNVRLLKRHIADLRAVEGATVRRADEASTFGSEGV
jgi:branched-chain amino acid transport system ATP-binding protein